MSDVKMDIPRCGNCGARFRRSLEVCDYCGYRVSGAAVDADEGGIPEGPPPTAPPFRISTATPAPIPVSAAPAPVTVSAPPHPPQPVQPPQPPQPVRSPQPVQPPSAGRAAPAGRPASPFAAVSRLSEVLDAPSVRAAWAEGCKAWGRWQRDERLSKAEERIAERAEAVFASAYLVVWEEDALTEPQYEALAGALAGLTHGALDADAVGDAMEEWDTELSDEDDYEGYLEWVSEVVKDPAMRRAVYEVAATVASLDGRQSKTEREVLVDLARALGIGRDEARDLSDRALARSRG